MPSPLFWPRCWSRRHGGYGDQGASRPPDAAHWPQTSATATRHRPIWQRHGTRSCSVPISVMRHRQALPLHPGVEHPQDEVKDLVVAQFALRSPLGHREMRQDKCLELGFRELDRNRRCCRLWCHGAHHTMASGKKWRGDLEKRITSDTTRG